MFLRFDMKICKPNEKKMYINSGPAQYDVILGYIKDSNAAAYSVHDDVFYVVIYLRLHAR